MEDPSDSVIENLGRRKRLMTTFMGQNPDAGTEEPLDECVQPPQSSTNGRGWNVFRGHKVMEQAEGCT